MQVSEFKRVVAALRSRRAGLSFSKKRGLRVDPPPGGLSDEEREALRQLSQKLRLGHIQPRDVGVWDGSQWRAQDARDRRRALTQVKGAAETYGTKLSRESLKAAIHLSLWLGRGWPRWMPGWVDEEEARKRLNLILRGRPGRIASNGEVVLVDEPRQTPPEPAKEKT